MQSMSSDYKRIKLAIYKKTKIDSYLIHQFKKWIMDQNVRAKTLEKTKVNVFVTLVIVFLGEIQKA